MKALLNSRFIRTPLEIECMRWSLIVIFVLFGYTKWFDYEAQALVPLIGNSPLLAWTHSVFGIQGASYLLGVAEWSIGLGLIVGLWSARITMLAAAGSCLTYLVTLSLIVTTPGAWEASAGGFPALGGASSFLLKDLVLLAGSLILLKHAVLQQARRCR
ncbi:DUF417 family protein [Pseudomonas sp.]|uniref:YkgB family protein n=1 Tax=Pseudomonas sp. TaxID=306 RepID=UPI0028A8F325|nr:DUF417 family protein [Pseudomonas sp.]